MATKIEDMDVGNDWVPLLWTMPVSPNFETNLKTNVETMKQLVGSRFMKVTENTAYLVA
jgi:hypothetical protein